MKKIAVMLMALTVLAGSAGCGRLMKTEAGVEAAKSEINENVEKETASGAVTQVKPETKDDTSEVPDETVPAETTAVQTSVPELSTSDLVGTWRSVRRDGNTLNTNGFVLQEDGTVQKYGHFLQHTKYYPMEGENGWYVPAMGFPGDRGTFAVAGNVIDITYTESAFEQIDPFTETLTVLSFGDGKLVLNDMYGTYIKDDGFSIDTLDLCAMLGVDTSVD